MTSDEDTSQILDLKEKLWTLNNSTIPELEKRLFALEEKERQRDRLDYDQEIHLDEVQGC